MDRYTDEETSHFFKSPILRKCMKTLINSLQKALGIMAQFISIFKGAKIINSIIE